MKPHNVSQTKSDWQNYRTIIVKRVNDDDDDEFVYSIQYLKCSHLCATWQLIDIFHLNYYGNT